MSELWVEVPEVNEFYEQVVRNADKYKLFPGEKFQLFTTGVAATTGVDSQGDCFAPEALFSMAEQMNNRVIWQHAEHNPLIQPIGRLIEAKVFYAPKTDVYFLAVVSGCYDINSIPTFKDLGIRIPDIDPEVSIELDVDLKTPQVQVGFNPYEIDQSIIHEILLHRPQFVDENPDFQFRKADSPLAILEIVATMWLLTTNPFSKKFLERCGEKSADGVIAFLNWLRKYVITKLSKVKNEKVLFKVKMDYKDCSIEFIVDSKDEGKLNKAIDTLHIAALKAVSIVDQLENFGVQAVVFEFECNGEKWQPRHAAAKLIGVISDCPVNVDVERYKGLSPSGSSKREKL